MMPPAACAKRPIASGESPGRVLVVDEEALVCWSLAAGLREAGFLTDTAATGAEALVLARVRPYPDAVLLDIRSLERDSCHLLRELRAIAPACRFLVMTTEGHAVPPEAHGASVVRKPFDLNDVVAQVRGQVRRARE